MATPKKQNSTKKNQNGGTKSSSTRSRRTTTPVNSIPAISTESPPTNIEAIPPVPTPEFCDFCNGELTGKDFGMINFRLILWFGRKTRNL